MASRDRIPVYHSAPTSCHTISLLYFSPQPLQTLLHTQLFPGPLHLLALMLLAVNRKEKATKKKKITAQDFPLAASKYLLCTYYMLSISEYSSSCTLLLHPFAFLLSFPFPYGHEDPHYPECMNQLRGSACCRCAKRMKPIA